MLNLAGEKIFFVDTHCQWYAGEDSELFVAALSYAGYDAGIMAIPPTTPRIEEIVRRCRAAFLVCRGSEQMFSFAHIIAMGYEGKMPEHGTPIEKLRQLRPHADLLLFAHPDLSKPELLHDGFREKLLDGFEYFNGYSFQHGNEIKRDFFNRYGYTPVAGCDTHNPKVRKRPNVVYNPEFPPNLNSPSVNDIDTFGGVRTLVFADECTPDAIADAIRHGRTLVEGGGKLCGNPEHVKKLEDAGYYEAVAESAARRRRLTLSSPTALISGRNATLHLREKVRGRVVCENREFPIDGDTFQFEIPAGLTQPHLALTVFDEENHCSLTSSLQLTPAVEMHLDSEAGKDGTAYVEIHLENHDADSRKGTLTFGENRKELCLNPGEKTCVRFPVHPNDPTVAENYSAVFAADGAVCSAERMLTFLRPGMTFRLDREEQVHKGVWKGPQDVSAEFTVTADSEGLHFHALVTDPVHVQKRHGHFLFFGDSIQIGITFDRICEKEFTFFNFQTALTETGPELHFTGAPPSYRGPFEPRELLDSGYCLIKPSGSGLEYNFTIPFAALNPYSPETDGKLHFFIRLFNCNGPQEEFFQGVKCALEYPLRSSCWMVGEGWASLSL